jgi:arginine utilization regulatory protein
MINNTSKKNSIEFGQIGKLNEYLDAIEKEIIFNCLRKNQDNITKTSRELGISRQNLQYKIKKYTSDK